VRSGFIVWEIFKGKWHSMFARQVERGYKPRVAKFSQSGTKTLRAFY
jgi:hypothetical protein